MRKMTRKTKITLAGLAAGVAAAAAVLAVLALGASPHHPRAQAARPAAPAPVQATSPDANTVICRNLGYLVPHLENVLMVAAGDPAAVAAAPGARAALREAANMLQAWSNNAEDRITRREMIPLPLDLLVTADQLRIAAAGLTDPNAATYAADALKGVTKADDDCAVLAHGTS